MNLLVARGHTDQVFLYISGLDSLKGQADACLQELSPFVASLKDTARSGTNWAIDGSAEKDLTSDFTSDTLTTSMWAMHGRLEELLHIAEQVK